MPLQINAVGSHGKIPKQVKGETNDACSAKRRSYARRHGKGIMAVYEVFRWWRGELGVTRTCMWRGLVMFLL